ncbi:MAG: YggS family pyridoxal phosphate-dependent enzyme [Nocardioides sp.]
MSERARRAELAANLAAVRLRIEGACAAAGRAPEAVTVIVVTKFFPATDVRILAELEVVDVGENRHPEAARKKAACLDLGLRWHFIGGLQTNKAPAVAGYADVVHSVDRAKLLPGLARGAVDRAEPLPCLIQVSLEDPERAAGASSARAGIAPTELLALADEVSAEARLRLAGLMAVAPVRMEPEVAFTRLARIREALLARHPEATVLSAGMTGDLEQAIAAGATHVRVGRAILGPRPVVE